MLPHHDETTSQVGVLLTNLGTPTAPTKKAVRHFLKEFLSDQRIIELPRFIWQCLLRGIILPIRSGKTAALYQKIWTQAGSPLFTISQQQQDVLQQTLNHDMSSTIKVSFAMRYGTPSIKTALADLHQQGIQRILIFPLYPQYSAATTASTFDAIAQALREWRHIPELRMINHYASEPSYIEAIATQIQQHWQSNGRADKLIFSFHGLPENSNTKGDPYSVQCQHTAKLVAQKLDLKNNTWMLTFQFRFGFAKWLQPYTDKTLASLPQQGIKSVDIICPGFSADCLETLEEISITNQKVFLHAGGKSYHYIPALNAEPVHINMMKQLIEKHTQGWLS
ncbi:MAG: ferrochelatase [Gammaproteobacteria bacterium]